MNPPTPINPVFINHYFCVEDHKAVLVSPRVHFSSLGELLVFLEKNEEAWEGPLGSPCPTSKPAYDPPCNPPTQRQQTYLHEMTIDWDVAVA